LILASTVTACSKDAPNYNIAGPSGAAAQSKAGQPLTAERIVSSLKGGPIGQIATAAWFNAVKIDCVAPCVLAWEVTVLSAPRPFHLEAAVHWSQISNKESTLENRLVWLPAAGGKTSFAIGEGTAGAVPRYSYNTADHTCGRTQPDIDIVFDDNGERWNIVGEVYQYPTDCTEACPSVENGHVDGFFTNVTESLPTVMPPFPGSISIDVRFVALNVPDRLVALTWTGFPSGERGVGPKATWEKRHWTINAACGAGEQVFDFNWTPTPSEFGLGHLRVNGAMYTLTGTDNLPILGKQTGGMLSEPAGLD
jgi:hypothetical protein